jgi:demethylmenaquinone methyltransferase/2-methoxy-6-polyprenyl-1,4-benzoquinol methylase
LVRGSSTDALPPVAGEEKRRYVFSMFGALGPDYDRFNRLISCGLDRRWRRKATALLSGCTQVCDVGAGTGDMTRALFAQPGFTGRVVAFDPAPALWRLPRNAHLARDARCSFGVAEAEHLPLPDGSCDGVMSGFVMRNFFDFDLALKECARILSPGGVGVFLEMGHPGHPLWRRVFRFYFERLAPFVAALFARTPRAYRYLPASLARFPEQAEICSRFFANGFSQAEYKEYLGGAIVMYRVTK